jgi:hypothetical protein
MGLVLTMGRRDHLRGQTNFLFNGVLLGATEST